MLYTFNNDLFRRFLVTLLFGCILARKLVSNILNSIQICTPSFLKSIFAIQKRDFANYIGLISISMLKAYTLYFFKEIRNPMSGSVCNYFQALIKINLIPNSKLEVMPIRLA